MDKIDAHQHFWKFDPVRDKWITDEMSVLRRDFLPEDLFPSLVKNDFGGCVLVQVEQSERENLFLTGLAEKNDFIKGVVGWVDLQSSDVEERLAYFQSFVKLRGFRHLVQDEEDRAMMLKPGFVRGIKALKRYNYTYDILIFPDQLQYARTFIELFPDQRFVIDHLAKPYIKFKEIDKWREEIIRIAQYENTYCKISGMVTEADWKGWQEKDFSPYIDVVVNAFGTERIMFGSDWPVCLLAGDYDDIVDIVENYFSSYSQNEKDNIFGLNANKFYRL
ncbi:MAG TPA: amidohydrolase family protein [Puia sp.]